MVVTDRDVGSPTTYDIDEGIAHIQLDRPDRLNAVTAELYESLRRDLAQATKDEARVITIEGSGRAFCVGADMQNHGERERSAKERREYVWKAQKTCREIQTHSTPVVSKIHGYAIGAGAELAMSTDFIVMAEDAELRFPEVSIGTYVGGGITYTLTQRVGAARAKELVLKAATLTGEEAAEEGIVTETVEAERLDDATSELVDELASNAPIPMEFVKEQFGRVGPSSRDDMLTAEAEALLACMATDDWEEGVNAFSEDREPTFVGE